MSGSLGWSCSWTSHRAVRWMREPPAKPFPRGDDRLRETRIEIARAAGRDHVLLVIEPDVRDEEPGVGARIVRPPSFARQRRFIAEGGQM